MERGIEDTVAGSRPFLKRVESVLEGVLNFVSRQYFTRDNTPPEWPLRLATFPKNIGSLTHPTPQSAIALDIALKIALKIDPSVAQPSIDVSLRPLDRIGLGEGTGNSDCAALLVNGPHSIQDLTVVLTLVNL